MTAGPAAEQSADYAALAILGLLLSRHPGLVALEELVRELAEAPERHRLSEVAIHDGISDLVGDGLAYRLGRFVVASRAAVQARALLS